MEKNDKKKSSFGKRLYDAFLKTCLGISSSSIVLILFNLMGISSLPVTIGTYILVVPSIYAGLTIAKKKIDKKFDLDMYRSAQLVNSLQELVTYDKEIRLGKNFFWNEIQIYANKNGITLDTQDLNTINQLLYMINENYYDIISKNIRLTRDELVNKILEIIFLYIESHDKNLDDDDIKNIINSIFFIDNDIKKKMFKEFIQGKCKIEERIDYRIISKNVNRDSMFSNPYINTADDIVPFFQYDDCREYEMLIKVFIDKEYFNKYGDASSIDWNIPLIRDIMSLIVVEFDKELKEEVENYSPIDFITSFIYNLGVYCLVNNRNDVGPYEIVNVFKNWNVVPFNLRLSIVNRIFEKYELDIANHPFEIKEIHHQDSQRKIIQFPKN